MFFHQFFKEIHVFFPLWSFNEIGFFLMIHWGIFIFFTDLSTKTLHFFLRCFANLQFFLDSLKKFMSFTRFFNEICIFPMILWQYFSFPRDPLIIFPFFLQSFEKICPLFLWFFKEICFFPHDSLIKFVFFKKQNPLTFF